MRVWLELLTSVYWKNPSLFHDCKPLIGPEIIFELKSFTRGKSIKYFFWPVTVDCLAISITCINDCLETNRNLLSYSIPPQLDYSNDPCAGISQNSRYSTEFVQLEKIGKGGFGSVFKVGTVMVVLQCTVNP